MRPPSSLAGRLALLYAAALAVGLAVFAMFALVTIDRVQRASFDANLANEAAAAAALAAPDEHATGLDAEDAASLRRSFSARSNAALFDTRGRLMLATVVDVPNGIRLLAHATASELRDVDVDSLAVRAATAPIERDGRRYGTVVLWRAVDNIADVDRRAAAGFALAVPLLGLAALLVGRALARRALAPLRVLAVATTEIEATDLSRRVGAGGEDELGRLCATFDRMLARLEDAFERERRFAGDVAHEIRAPLAVIVAEVDVARRRPRSPDAYERALDTVRDEALALDALATSLLASYRGAAPPSTAGRFTLDAAVDEAAALLAPLAATRGVALDIAGARELTIVGDRSEVVRALVAMLDNALKYGAGTTIVVRTARLASTARATVEDGGPGFSHEALAHATERFWRAAGTHGRDGSGLGLAISTAIAERAGGVLTIANGPRGGGLVTLDVPLEHSSRSHLGKR